MKVEFHTKSKILIDFLTIKLKKFKKLHFQSLIRQNSHYLYVRICPHMEEYMNYYNEIKNELINNEITKREKTIVKTKVILLLIIMSENY